MKSVAAVLLGTLAFTHLVSASAEQVYRGVLRDAERYVPVTLTVVPDMPLGQRAGNVRFGGTWQCGFNLENVGVEQQAHIYGLAGYGPGRCGLLVNGQLRVGPDAQPLNVTLHDRQGKNAFTLDMEPVER